MKMSNFAAEMMMRAPTAIKETAQTTMNNVIAQRTMVATGTPQVAANTIQRFTVVQPDAVKTVIPEPPPPPGQPASAYMKPVVTKETDNTYQAPPDKVVIVTPPPVRTVVDQSVPTAAPKVVQPPAITQPPATPLEPRATVMPVTPGYNQQEAERVMRVLAEHDTVLKGLSNALNDMSRMMAALVDKVNTNTAQLGEVRGGVNAAMNTAQTADQNVNTLANNISSNLGMFNEKVNVLGEALNQLLTGVAETFTPRRNTQQGDGISRGHVATVRASQPASTMTVDADGRTADDTGRTKTVNGYYRGYRGYSR